MMYSFSFKCDCHSKVNNSKDEDSVIDREFILTYSKMYVYTIDATVADLINHFKWNISTHLYLIFCSLRHNGFIPDLTVKDLE